MPFLLKRPSSWWLNQPNWKIWSSNWIIFPNFRGEKKKTSLSCHHLAFHVLVLQSSSPPFSRPSAPSPGRRSFDHQTRSRIEAVELGAVRWYLADTTNGGLVFQLHNQPRGYSVQPVCSYVVFVFWVFFRVEGLQCWLLFLRLKDYYWNRHLFWFGKG